MRDSRHLVEKRLNLLKHGKVISDGKVIPLKTSKQNVKHIIEFIEYGYSIKKFTHTRVLKYLYYLPKIAEWLNVSFKRATKKDIQRVLAKVETLDVKENTKTDYKIFIKRFYKWLEGDDEEYPKKVWGIHPKPQKNNLEHSDLLTEDEVKRLITAADGIRDKAFIAVLYEGGFRIGEVLNSKLKHISVNGDVVRYNVPKEGKTGQRLVPLVTSVPYLSNWINVHPDRNNPESYLWPPLHRDKNKPMSYAKANSLLKIAAKKAGITKRVNPHIFRHSRATLLATKLKGANLNGYMGWSQSTKMASVYIHLSGKETEEAYLSLHGKGPVNDELDKNMKSRTCPRCDHSNDPTTCYCLKCMLPLDEKTLLKNEKTTTDILSILNKKEVLEKLVKIVEEAKLEASKS